MKGRDARSGAVRVLDVLARPSERPRHGLMQHEFIAAFSSGGWTMADFKAATKFAYEAGWIRLDAQHYCLTDLGRCTLSEEHGGTKDG